MNTNEFFRRALALVLALGLLFAMPVMAAEADDDYRPVVTVGTVDEFLQALQGETRILMKPGVYDLTTAKDYGTICPEGASYTWEECFDGYQLCIQDLGALEIRAEEPGTVSIVTAPRYAHVLSFIYCCSLQLQNLTIGHSEGPGECSGSVVDLYGCMGVNFESCDLYGCGTIAVSGAECEFIDLHNCLLRECSSGALEMYYCMDVRACDCEIRDCGTAESPAWNLLSFTNTNGAALVNCNIHDNNAYSLLSSWESDDAALLGTSVKNNASEYMIAADRYSPIIEGCVFEGNSTSSWYGSDFDTACTVAVDGSGKALAAEDFLSMQRGEQDYEAMIPFDLRVGDADDPWTVYHDAHDLMKTTMAKSCDDVAEYMGSGSPEDPWPGEKRALPRSQLKSVTVSTVWDLLDAIASDTIIYLEPGDYCLSDDGEYGAGREDYYYWNEVYDGYELVISGVENLWIVGKDPADTRIIAMPRYANVMSLSGCRNIVIQGVTLGHDSTLPGECSGGVLNLDHSSRVRVAGCGLFGCGIYGVIANRTDDVTVWGTEIYHCSYGAGEITDSSNFRFEDCAIHDCYHDEIYLVGDCSDMTMDGKELAMG